MAKSPTLRQVYESEETFHCISASCPHCQHDAIFGELLEFGCDDRTVLAAGYMKIHLGCCMGCNELVVGVFRLIDVSGQELERADLLWPITTWPDNAPPGLDVEIKKDYDEARAIIGLSPQAAATLARRCVQHVIRKTMSITKKTLFKEIEEAVAKDDLTKSTKAAIDHVRKIGNWGAHPDEDQASVLIEVTDKEARYTLEAVELLFNDLYVTPQKVASMGIAIGQKQTGQPQPHTPKK